MTIFFNKTPPPPPNHHTNINSIVFNYFAHTITHNCHVVKSQTIIIYDNKIAIMSIKLSQPL
jgi:hypothetical protein